MLSTVVIKLTAPAKDEIPVAWRKHGARVWRIHEPTAVGGATQEPREVDENSAEEQCPETERVDARECNVARTNLQRNEIVGEACSHRHHEQEHHRCGVHCEHLVVQVGIKHLAVWCR
jgi:hypothetical protein